MGQKIHKIGLLLGSNRGQSAAILHDAINFIENECGRVMKRSSIYKTAPWGNARQHQFLNIALEISSALGPFQLLRQFQKIEKLFGRKNKQQNQSRTLDIDILFYGEAQIRSKKLIIPHPRLAERRFALIPLAEILPQYMHPVYHKTIKELLDICPDTLKVVKFATV